MTPQEFWAIQEWLEPPKLLAGIDEHKFNYLVGVLNDGK